MFYYCFHFESPYVGTDRDYFYTFDEKPSEDELQDMTAEICADCAEDYSYLAEDETETAEEIEDALDWYYDNCECTYEEISEKEHEAAVG